MTSERQPKHAPAPSRRPAVAPATAPQRSASRAGAGPADLQLRFGNQGTQALLSQLTGAYAERASAAPERAATSERADNYRTAPSPDISKSTPPQAVPVNAPAAEPQAMEAMPASAAATPPTGESPLPAAGPSSSMAAGPSGEGPEQAPEAVAPSADASAASRAALPDAAGEPAPRPAGPETAAVAAVAPSEAIAPAVTAIGARVRVARSHAPAAAATDAAQAAALTAATEQQRSAAAATVTNLAAAEPGKVDRSDFKAKLAEALRRAIPTPRTEDEAESVMKEGARNASSALQGELHAQSSQAAGPMAAASSPAAEINPASMPAPALAQLTPEQAGPAPAPVAADSVVPQPLPPAQLDYSSDRASTDRVMAENKVTSQQLQRANEPSFSAAAEARQSAETREAQMPGQFRTEEAGVHDQAHAKASQSIAKGLGDVHGSRTARMAGVSAQQTATRDVDAAERARITQELERIKTQTRADVQVILDDMEKTAGEMFQQGLGRAEKAYGDVFEEEKGGVGTWLTTWGDDWEELIERSLVTAKAAYDAEVSRTIDAVATYVEGKLAEAKRRVEAGRTEVDRFVAGLKGSVAQFGRDGGARIAGDFEAMTGEIDQRRDHLVDNLVQQYSESQKRVSALEQKLREENKSLWQRVYDATVGVIKTIIAFKDMLLNVLSRAAGVIDQILSDPIGFLGNLIAGVQAGFSRFSDNIVEHLKQGLLGWLFGVMEGAGLKLPKEFDFAGILSLILQVLGLTAENVRKRAVGILGAETVERLEQAGGIFVKLVTEGPAALWDMLVEKLGSIKDTIFEQIQAWVAENVIKQGILWLISLFNPVAAFIKACIGIYDLVMFFIERAKQIAALINAIIDTLSVIVSGNIEKMAQAVEDALARGLTFAIGLLASLLHLGGISDSISNIIKSIQKPVNAAIDWVIHKSVALVKGAGKAIGGLFGKKGKENSIAKDPVKAGKPGDGDLQYTANFTMSGASHELHVEGRADGLFVGMASGRLQNLGYLVAEAQMHTKNEALYNTLDEISQELVTLDLEWKEIEAVPSEELTEKRKKHRQRIVDDAGKLTSRIVRLGKRFKITSLSDLGNPSQYQSGGFVLEKYRNDGQIRATFYRSGYRAPAEKHRDDYVDSFNDPAHPGMFKDEKKQTWEPKATRSIDHVVPVVVHWNNHDGNNMNQTARLNWYSDISNHLIVAQRNNSSEGGKLGITYTWEVGPNFRGPKEDAL